MTTNTDNKINVEYLPITQLKPDLGNPRRITDAELTALCRSIETFGFVSPVVARAEDRQVIGGHQRLTAALRLGLTHVPVILVNVNDDEARLLGLALNRISGSWDEQLLGRLLQDLKLSGADVSLTGFDSDEVADFLKTLETREKRSRAEHFDAGAFLTEARRAAARSKPGDLYELGPHRLLCGDSASPDAFQRLVGDERVDLVFTDPPYGADYVPEERPVGGRARSDRQLGGILNDQAPEQLIEAVWQNIAAVSQPGTVYYICAGTRIAPLVQGLLTASCGREPTIIVWGKQSFSLGRRDYQRQHEFLFYNWMGSKHSWNGGRRQSDLWLEDREPAATYSHPTQKPLTLIERAIRNSSQEGALVLDPFLGSGTTLIACERTGRTCYGMELDPFYADTVVARWESFAGQKAVRTPATATQSNLAESRA